MENKINIARFKEGSRTAEVKGIWQWDYGQILRIQGLSLPTAVEIHFSLDEHGGEAARRIGVTKDGVTDVPIPDSMVENESAYGDSYYFFAYIYLSDEESGNTEYKIRAKVSTRSKPEGYVSGGNDTFAEILKTVNEIASDKVDVPVPAKVGQVIAVSEVDEEGKPIEFEAKDMSGGVSAGTGLSTEAIDKLEEVGNYLAYTTADGGSKWTELISILRNGSSGGGSSETVPATGITLDKTTLSFTDSATQTLVTTVEPSDTTDKVVWTSNAESVAKVTNGVVKPLSNGSATITATCGSVSATCFVTVDIAEGGQVTLTSISATYTGGDVAVGTSLNDLTGITVTAHYSDGSTSNITEYTLSGTIVEGENTITVSYGGKTTTFIVVGISEPALYPLNNGELYNTYTGVTLAVTNGNHLEVTVGNSEISMTAGGLVNLNDITKNTTDRNWNTNSDAVNNQDAIFAISSGSEVVFSIKNWQASDSCIKAGGQISFNLRKANAETSILSAISLDSTTAETEFISTYIAEEDIEVGAVIMYAINIAANSNFSCDIGLTVNGVRYI